jgi:crotonobetainyl-CoA:carnitine CoA-transferase CaiB-like acyl-CoA transferase
VALGDAVSGINAAVAVLIALYHKQQTGEGQFIDLSQIECLLPLGAHGMIEYSLNKTDWPRLGSKHPEYSPYGIYPCDGDEAWLTITCTTDDHWQALATTMNMRQLLQDKRFTNATTRKENEDELDAIIAAWTIKLDPQEAMTVLQSAVVPAAVVRSTQNLVDDPQLQSRGYFEWGKGVHRDLVLYPLPAFTMNGHRQQVRWPAPKLGEHNEQVLKNKLGLSDDEVQALVDKQIIGTVPIIPGE